MIKPVIITNIWDRNERLVSKTKNDKAGRMQEVTNKAFWRDGIDYVSSYTDLVSSKNKLKAYIKMVGMNPSEDSFDINRNIFNADSIVYWNIGHGNCYKQTIKEMLFPGICETYNNQWQSDFVPPKDILEYEIGRNILMRMIDTNYEIRSSIECINDLSQLSENIFSGLGGYDPYLFPYILNILHRYVNADICDDASYQRCVEMISKNEGVVSTIIKFKTLIDHNISSGFNAYIDWDSFLDEHMMFLLSNTNSLTNHISDKCFITSISACDGNMIHSHTIQDGYRLPDAPMICTRNHPLCQDTFRFHSVTEKLAVTMKRVTEWVWSYTRIVNNRYHVIYSHTIPRLRRINLRSV